MITTLLHSKPLPICTMCSPLVVQDAAVSLPDRIFHPLKSDAIGSVCQSCQMIEEAGILIQASPAADPLNH
ncbi:MAG: hypothetical protein D3926_10655 [Desulfobacteraceae bacterium]|nr:MAG: hypothetical protein D3926_10655 [Desulfobacteraceae bacterium]